MTKDNNAKTKTLKDWIKFYEDKTGDSVSLLDGFQMYWLAERGFCQYKIDIEGKMLIIYQVSGDAKFWHDMGEIICLANNLDYMSTICTRNINAYMRFWKWEVAEEFNVNNQKRFICKDVHGRKVIITHQGINDKGNPTYYVTQYLNERSEEDNG